MNVLETLELKITAATADLGRACAAKWPVGSTVEFTISARQIRPSLATVVEWNGVRVWVRKEKPARVSHKWINWKRLR